VPPSRIPTVTAAFNIYGDVVPVIAMASTMPTGKVLRGRGISQTHSVLATLAEQSNSGRRQDREATAEP